MAHSKWGWRIYVVANGTDVQEVDILSKERSEKWFKDGRHFVGWKFHATDGNDYTDYFPHVHARRWKAMRHAQRNVLAKRGPQPQEETRCND